MLFNTITATVLGLATLGAAQNQFDGESRSAWTQRTAREMAAQNPGKGVVVCNVGWTGTGTFQRSSFQWERAGFRQSFVTFDIVVLDPGATFTRQGDGGFDNWAFSIPPSCRRTTPETIAC